MLEWRSAADDEDAAEAGHGAAVALIEALAEVAAQLDIVAAIDP